MAQPEQTSEPDAGGSLQSLGDKGEVPKSRLATAQAARSMLTGLIRGDNEASIKRSMIQGMIDRNPMLTDAQVRKAGLAFLPRANWGGAAAKVKSVTNGYWDILTSPEQVSMVIFTKGDVRNLVDWSQIASEEMHRTLFKTYPDWSFIYHMKLHVSQKVIHGIGPVFWRGKRDWRFWAVKRRNIQYPKEAPSDITRMRVVFIRDFMYVDELFELCEKGLKGETNRWSKPNVLDAIRSAQIKDEKQFDWEVCQERFKNNSYDWAYNESKVVPVAHVFVREFPQGDSTDGKLSHHIFHENAIPDEKLFNKDEVGVGYIYSAINEYDHIGQAIWACYDDVGNGDSESVRGMGTEVFHYGEADNRLKNALIQSAIEAGTPYFVAENAELAKKMTRIEMGPYKIIPTGYTMQQMNTGQGVQAMLTAAAYFDQQESNQTGVYKSRTDQGKQPRTAREVDADVSETSKLDNAQVADYCMQADRLMAEVGRRLSQQGILETDPGGKEALDFKRRCIERGIPEELFHGLFETAQIGITRPIGNGSFMDRINRLTRISQFMGDMPQRKRALFIRDSIAFIAGNRQMADRYGPDLEQQFPGIEASLAILENTALITPGAEDPFSPDNAHEVHLPIHLDFATKLLQGEDKQQASQGIDMVYQHMSEHLDALEKDPTRRKAFDQFRAKLGAMQNDIKKLHRTAELLAAAQPPAPEQDPDVITAQRTQDRKDGEVQADMQRKGARTEQAIRIKDVTTAQGMMIKSEQHQQDLKLAKSAKGKK